jgi:hypothetical protein
MAERQHDLQRKRQQCEVRTVPSVAMNRPHIWNLTSHFRNYQGRVRTLGIVSTWQLQSLPSGTTNRRASILKPRVQRKIGRQTRLREVKMRTPLTILGAFVLVLVGTLAIMNSACKSGAHGWCAPMSAVHNDLKLEPPAQYDHPYDGPVVERVIAVAKARALCTSLGASPRSVACSWVSDGTCYIVLPKDEQAPVSAFRRHETAHCNGWPVNHRHG